jgi:hypothetical protein
LFPGYAPWGVESGLDSSQNILIQISKTPIAMVTIFIFIMFANLILKFSEWVDQMSLQLVGEDAAALATPSAPANAAKSEAKGIAMDTASNAWKFSKYAGGILDNLPQDIIKTGAKIADIPSNLGIGKGGYRALIDRQNWKPSDAAKIFARNAVPSLLPKTVSNAILGSGRDGSIGGDKMGYGTSFMTGSEKSGYDKTKKDFESLSAEKQQNVRDAHMRDSIELSDKKKELRGIYHNRPDVLKVIDSSDNIIKQERKTFLSSGPNKHYQDSNYNVFNSGQLNDQSRLSDIYNTPPGTTPLRSSSDILEDAVNKVARK